jgi:outer membrane protein assembly factor BamA
MDRNGRIPKVPLPADIDNPERWRYIPEGRIKPGNIFQRFLVSSFVAPFVFNNSDVGTGFGVGFTDIDFRTQRRREFAGLFFSYTTKGQQRYGISWRRMLKTRDLPTGGVIQEERSFVFARVSYSKTLTLRFFGFGPNTIASQESSYLDEAIQVAVGFSYSLPKPVDDLVVEGRIDAAAHLLGSGTVQGAFDMAFRYPFVFAAFQDWNYGSVGLELRWDTRDSQRNPYSGHEIGARADALLAQTGANVGAVFTIFGSKVFEVPGIFHDGGDDFEQHPPTDTLAFSLFTQATSGVVPFYLLPTLGGRNTLRGYIQGRWRDRAAWHGSVEYRLWVIPRGIPITRNIRIERIGLAGFYDVGAVAGTWPDIFSSKVSHSYGFGARISLERAAIFRLDLGFSPEDINFIASFGLPF